MFNLTGHIANGTSQVEEKTLATHPFLTQLRPVHCFSLLTGSLNKLGLKNIYLGIVSSYKNNT